VKSFGTGMEGRTLEKVRERCVCGSALADLTKRVWKSAR